MTRRGRPQQRGGELEPPKQSSVQERVKNTDEQLDEALTLTFPASDPVALVQPTTHVGSNADAKG